MSARARDKRVFTFSPARSQLLTLAALATMELLSWLALGSSTLTVLLIIVTYSSFSAGSRAGVTSAALTSLYAAYYFSIPGKLLHYTHEDLLRLLIFPVTSVTIALMVGALRRKAHESEHVLRCLADAAFEGIIIHAQGEILEVNQSCANMFGYELSEIGARSVLDLFAPESRDLLANSFRSGSDEPFEAVGVRGDGATFTVEVRGKRCSYRGIDARVAAIRDITERKTLEKQLVEEAMRDPLTRLPNRSLFMESLNRALSRAARQKRSLAVLFLDVDRLKSVNDTLGHEAGDRLLIEVGTRLQRCLRAQDIVAQLGEVEFEILLEDIDGPGDATVVAERIVELLREPVRIMGREIRIGASIGIALGGLEKVTPEELLRDADLAMYRTKRTGRGRYMAPDAYEPRSYSRSQPGPTGQNAVPDTASPAPRESAGWNMQQAGG